ncbi:AUGMIN subunit 6-like [Zingiber officinale]|uniref:AUGMIN subunit 6-like n=1 Tax=Zingiber officinale TaxID=94328 RepID=UPI001C4D7CEE|nr:AUGMIN subunit 6-like [Zingiber officinale]
MATDREKEREAELESAMYTNCLLLGLDPSVLGVGQAGGGPFAGHFRHSNPKLGEQLLYFLLCALRGSAKEFDRVWPIFDSAQSRDFRKIVQGIISELESQGVLPRSNSRVSSLATCCGPRFVELLWQLSVHALREVHQRTFADDISSNSLPPVLTEASYQNAAALLQVTKARIALERRKFMEKANAAVHRQSAWSNLAHEMTAEFRSLCAEEAYLQQELEKLQDMLNKAKVEGESFDDHIPSSLGQNSHLIAKATRLWESLLARRSQHEILASGPIEDLIALREHRYRISGSALLAATDQSSHIPSSDAMSVSSDEVSSHGGIREHMDSLHCQGKSNTLLKMVDKGVAPPTVDVAEIFRRWTHALQRIHKHSLHLVKANDGEGPELLQTSSNSSTSGHGVSMAATLAEHHQHLVSIQGLVSQLKEAIPSMQKSIAELTEEVNISSTTMDGFSARSTLSTQSQVPQGIANDEIDDLNSRLSSIQSEKVSASSVLKLPHLISVAPNSSAKSMHTAKQSSAAESVQEYFPTVTSVTPQIAHDHADENGNNDVRSIRRSVRESALSGLANNSKLRKDRSNDHGSQHYFLPMSTGASLVEVDASPIENKRGVFPPPEIHVPSSYRHPLKTDSQLDSHATLSDNSLGIHGHTSLQSLTQSPIVNLKNPLLDINDSLDQVYSPPFLMDSSFFQDAYEDLLAPLSETEVALIDY